MNGLTSRQREIVTAYLRVPNTPDCSPEVLRLMRLYGRDLGSVREQVDALRESLGMDYGVLQPLLQRKLLY